MQNFESLNFLHNAVTDLAEESLIKIATENKFLKDFKFDGNEISPKILKEISIALEEKVVESVAESQVSSPALLATKTSVPQLTENLAAAARHE